MIFKNTCDRCPMTCYFHHRLFLILCVRRSVRECLHLINCGPKIKRSHFLLVTPVTRAQLQDGCVFLWPAVRPGGREGRQREMLRCREPDAFPCHTEDDQLGQTHAHTDETMWGAWERSIELVCIILLQDDRRQLVALSHYQKPDHQRHNHSIFSPFINYGSRSLQTTLTGKGIPNWNHEGGFSARIWESLLP